MTVDELMAVQPVIPVITVERVEDAAPLAHALVSAGLRVLEVTLRTEQALACMRAMSRTAGAIVGAGTVLTANDVMLAREAGAQFIVTPGLSASTVAAARQAEPADPAWHCDGDGADGGARPWARPLQILPGRAGGRPRYDRCVQGTVRKSEVLPDGRHHARPCAGLSYTLQRGVRRRRMGRADQAYRRTRSGTRSAGWRRRRRR